MKENIIFMVVLIIIIIILGVPAFSEAKIIKGNNNRLIIPNVSDNSKYREIKENKFKDFVYALSGSTNTLIFPYINLNNVKTVNDDIYKLKDQSFNNLNKDVGISASYQAFLNNDILSVYLVITNIESGKRININNYHLYNISLDNQELLTYSKLLEKYNLDYNKVNELLKLGVKERVDYYLENLLRGDEGNYEKRSIEQFEQDLKDDKIQAIITSEKKLICTINLILPDYDKYEDAVTIDISNLF